MSEWDPWKRFLKEREKRYWDPYYRVEYERDRLSWDPFFRAEKHIDRMHWDPYYRVEKLIEKKYSDSRYKQRIYEERRMSGDWLELYYENPMDLVLRDRYRMLYGNSNINTIGNSESKRVLELLGTISVVNRMYDRGLGFWLRLVLKISAIGFLVWIIWSLLTWRLLIP